MADDLFARFGGDSDSEESARDDSLCVRPRRPAAALPCGRSLAALRCALQFLCAADSPTHAPQ